MQPDSPNQNSKDRGQSKIPILLVDDRAENLVTLEAVLGAPGYLLVSARSGAEALALLKKQVFALVLLDVQMPGMDGFETARQIRALSQSRFTPIIFVTAIQYDEDYIDRGYEVGAVDYLFKPLNVKTVRAKVAVFAELFKAKLEIQEHEREKKERENETRLKLITDSIPGFISYVDTQERYQFTNQAYTEWLGLPDQEIHGLMMRDFLGEESYRIAEPHIRTALAGKSVQYETTVVNRRDGKQKHILANYLPHRNDQGQVIGLIIVGQDVTRLKTAEIALEKSYVELEQRVKARTQELFQVNQQLKLLYEEQTESAETLRQSEMFLESVIQNIPNMIFVKDAKDLRFLRFNKAGEELLGLNQRDLIGKNDYDFFSKSEADAFVAKDREVLSQREIIDIPEEPILTRARGPRILHTKKIPVLDQAGTPRYLLGISEDITELKRQEEQRLNLIKEQAARAEAEKAAGRLSFLAEASAVLGGSLDYSTTLTTVANLVVSKLADWCSVDILDENDHRLHNLAVAHIDPTKVALALELQKRYPPRMDSLTGAPQVIRTGKSEFYPEIPVELLEKAANDEEHLRIMLDLGLHSAIVVPLEVRHKVLGTLTLISAESKRSYDHRDLELAEELARRAAVAIENSKLYGELQEAVRSRDEFLSICSHELKTPVTSLKLQNQMAARSIAKGNFEILSPERLLKLFNTTNRQVDRMSRLIEDMLDIARIATGRLTMTVEKVDFGQLILEVTDRFSEEIKAIGATMELNLAPSIFIEGDKYRIEQVISNMITNAIKYGDRKPITILLTSHEKIATLSVRDHGIGIAKENQERIFNRFERAISANSISGLGLGLYIVRQILDAHQGSIRVESELKQGSNFIVELPIV